MPLIKLKGELDLDLQILGLKEGQIVSATPCNFSKAGLMYFTVIHNNFKFNCSVWPCNYEVLNDLKENKPIT